MKSAISSFRKPILHCDCCDKQGTELKDIINELIFLSRSCDNLKSQGLGEYIEEEYNKFFIKVNSNLILREFKSDNYNNEKLKEITLNTNKYEISKIKEKVMLCSMCSEKHGLKWCSLLFTDPEIFTTIAMIKSKFSYLDRGIVDNFKILFNV